MDQIPPLTGSFHSDFSSTTAESASPREPSVIEALDVFLNKMCHGYVSSSQGTSSSTSSSSYTNPLAVKLGDQLPENPDVEQLLAFTKRIAHHILKNNGNSLFVNDANKQGLVDRLYTISRAMQSRQDFSIDSGVLLDDAAEIVELYLNNLNNADESAQRNHGQVCQKLGINLAATIKSIEVSTKSDPHNGCQQTCFIRFSDNSVIIYKPRSDLYERNICGVQDSIFNLVNQNLREELLPTLNITSFEDSNFLFVKPINYEPTITPSERSMFFKRIGALTCMSQVLGISDLNRDNMIASGGHIVPIDLEVAFDPRVIAGVYPTGLHEGLFGGPGSQSFTKDHAGAEIRPNPRDYRNFLKGYNTLKGVLTANRKDIQGQILHLIPPQRRYTPVPTSRLIEFTNTFLQNASAEMCDELIKNINIDRELLGLDPHPFSPEIREQLIECLEKDAALLDVPIFYVNNHTGEFRYRDISLQLFPPSTDYLTERFKTLKQMEPDSAVQQLFQKT